MSAEKYITASCIVSNYAVYKSGEKVFENKEASFSDFLLSVYRYAGVTYPKFYKMDNLSKLGWLTTEILLKDSFIAGNYLPVDTGIVLTNSSASLDTDIKYYETVKDIASPALFVYTLPNIVIGEISIRHGLKGENAFFINEQFDGAFIEEYVSNLINNNILQACICGWVDVLKDAYKVVLFLIEKKPSRRSIVFTKENIIKIYQSENG